MDPLWTLIDAPMDTYITRPLTYGLLWTPLEVEEAYGEAVYV